MVNWGLLAFWILFQNGSGIILTDKSSILGGNLTKITQPECLQISSVESWAAPSGAVRKFSRWQRWNTVYPSRQAAERLQLDWYTWLDHGGMYSAANDFRTAFLLSMAHIRTILVTIPWDVFISSTHPQADCLGPYIFVRFWWSLVQNVQHCWRPNLS